MYFREIIYLLLKVENIGFLYSLYEEICLFDHYIFRSYSLELLYHHSIYFTVTYNCIYSDNNHSILLHDTSFR